MKSIKMPFCSRSVPRALNFKVYIFIEIDEYHISTGTLDKGNSCKLIYPDKCFGFYFFYNTDAKSYYSSTQV